MPDPITKWCGWDDRNVILLQRWQKHTHTHHKNHWLKTAITKPSLLKRDTLGRGNLPASSRLQQWYLSRKKERKKERKIDRRWLAQLLLWSLFSIFCIFCNFDYLLRADASVKLLKFLLETANTLPLWFLIIWAPVKLRRYCLDVHSDDWSNGAGTTSSFSGSPTNSAVKGFASYIRITFCK